MCRVSQSQRTGYRLSVAAWLVAVLALFMTLTTSAAEACPKSGAADGAIRSAGIIQVTAIAFEAEDMAYVTAVSPTAGTVSQPHCCVSGGFCSGAGCASACCAAWSTAVDRVSAGIDLLDVNAAYVCFGQGGIISTPPPPDFRPPRFIA